MFYELKIVIKNNKTINPSKLNQQACHFKRKQA